MPFAPAIANSIEFQEAQRELGAEEGSDGVLQGYDRYAVIYKALEARFEQRSGGFAVAESRDTWRRYLKGGSILPLPPAAEVTTTSSPSKTNSPACRCSASSPQRADDLAPLATLQVSGCMTLANAHA